MLKNIVFLLSFMLCNIVHAEDMSIYETEVEVDATAANAAAAREKAMTEANRKALYAVINRISSASSTEILDKLNDNQILNFIREVSVVSEKVTNSRYQAALKIIINAPILKTYLSEKNAPVTVLPETHVLILPVYRENTTAMPLLWEENNLWRTTWMDNETTSGQITIKTAINSKKNRNAITAEDTSVLNKMSLMTISHIPDMSDIYTAELTETDTGINAELKSPAYGVVLSRVIDNKSQETLVEVVESMKNAIIQKIQQHALNKQNASNKLILVFNFKNLREWLSLQTSLKNVNNISKINIDAMSNRQSQVSIEYTGTQENLYNKFLQQNLRLINEGDTFTVERI